MNDQQFLEIIKNTPLVSIDLIIRNERDEVLLGMRTHEPARGWWFVPGGRIVKDESLDAAFERVLKTETGIDAQRSSAILKGAYEHLYPVNRFGAEGVSTHYVVLAHELRISGRTVRPADDQHSEYRWFSIRDLLASEDVHDRTKDYFS